MKKKISIIFVVVLLVVILTVIFVPIYKINQVFTYEVNKDKGEVIITGYLADEKAIERYKKGYDDKPIYPKKITIPDRIKGYPVTVIGESAFEGARAEEIVMPDTVRKLDKKAFDGCKNLKLIEGTMNVEEIGEYAFSGCEELEVIDMTGVTYIGPSAFAGSEKLKAIVIPSTMKEIPYAMCMGVDSLESVVIPEGVESIDALAFAFSWELKAVYVPVSVTMIHSSAFADLEEQITIYGVKGSYAEKYAIAKGIKFEEFNE